MTNYNNTIQYPPRQGLELLSDYLENHNPKEARKFADGLIGNVEIEIVDINIVGRKFLQKCVVDGRIEKAKKIIRAFRNRPYHWNLWEINKADFLLYG